MAQFAVIILPRSYYVTILVIHHMSDSMQSKSLEDLSPVEIDTIMTTKVQPPKFDRSNTELWFVQLEHYFTRQNIKSEGIRYRDFS